MSANVLGAGVAGGKKFMYFGKVRVIYTDFTHICKISIYLSHVINDKTGGILVFQPAERFKPPLLNAGKTFHSWSEARNGNESWIGLPCGTSKRSTATHLFVQVQV
jgi:hypothetical protein